MDGGRRSLLPDPSGPVAGKAHRIVDRGGALMDIGEALYRHITNGRSPNTEVTSFGAAVDWLVAKYGSASAAGRAVGVAPSTFRHWVNGRQPSGDRAYDVTAQVRADQRRSRLSRKRESRLRGPGAMEFLEFDAEYTYDASNRTVQIGLYVDDDCPNAVIDAFLAGADTYELQATFALYVADPSEF